MKILGISCHYHDAAACLVADGRVVAAAQEERFSRIKHDPSFPTMAIRYCMDESGLASADLDYVVYYEKPFLKFDRILRGIIATYPRSCRFFREAVHSYLGDKLWVKGEIASRLGVDPRRILFVDHHLSHASSAFFASPFAEAAILTVDGVGEWATATLSFGQAAWGPGGRNEIRILRELRFPHSLGLLYSAFTAFLGFEVNEGEYKVMGMAPYGKPRYLDRVTRVARVERDGSITLDLSYFAFHYDSRHMFSSKFIELFGPPRNPKARFVTTNTSLYDDPDEPSLEELERNQYYADIAASIQCFTEEALLAMARELYRLTGTRNLCVAGGVGLNSVANYRLLRETPFENIYVQPAAGDAGGSVGAALYAYHALLGRPRSYVMDHAYLGKRFTEAETADFLARNHIPHCRFSNDESLTRWTAERIAEGKVVGWHQGRFEWGPRALGCRSILADPRDPRMKDIVNIKIKFREPFRPFAPSVLADEASDYFNLAGKDDQHPFRFMLLVAPVLRPDTIPAVTHFDGTGRLQIVDQHHNALYHRLLKTFRDITGVPVLLNTSFNLKGEPIVTSPADAFQTFRASGMDVLVVGPFAIEKDKLHDR